VFVALGIQQAMRMRYIVICGLSGFKTYSTLSHKWHDFRGKSLLNTKCVYWFSLQILSQNISHSKNNRESYDREVYVGVHVKYSLFLYDFHETWIFSTDFRNTFKNQTSWKSVKWDHSRYMWTYITKLIVAYGNLANAPKFRSLAINKY